ncbi:MAG: hypothetical protein QOK05_606 [Chloroflexota bacterium]|jgi:protein-S-isoprenylcysteine O-methyltransferase Ste14|nr:hypothetical protein [Chloroflexota bacterium]
MSRADAIFARPHGLTAVALVITGGVWLLVDLTRSFHRRSDAATVDRGSRLFLSASYFVGVLLAPVLARSVPGAVIRPDGLASWLGFVFIWAGILLRAWSFRTLGTYFTFRVQTSADQPVISAGPYRFVRHPSYVGILLAFIGFALAAFGNWMSVASMGVGALIGVLYRIRVEERELLLALGDPYRDYAATHKRLIPMVW